LLVLLLAVRGLLISLLVALWVRWRDRGTVVGLVGVVCRDTLDLLMLRVVAHLELLSG
jgi:hypothetical protein